MRAFLEIWKDIAGYEGLYQVSNLGNVRSLGRWRGNGKGVYFQEGQIIKPFKNKRGYQIVDLRKNGRKNHYVHRLVAQSFIENPENLPCINHKDESKTNNRVDNLEWCSYVYNNNYGTRNKRMAESKSKKVIQLTLDGKIVREWASTVECGLNGFNKGHVAECCRGERKTHKGYRWVYAEDYFKQAA